MTVRLFSKDGQLIASIPYPHILRHKYGCSDERYHKLDSMPYRFWLTIQESKSAGFRTLDLGLEQFKSDLGAVCSTLTYYRYPPQPPPSLLRIGAAGADYAVLRPDALLGPRRGRQPSL
jgi:hypothetical protein